VPRYLHHPSSETSIKMTTQDKIEDQSFEQLLGALNKVYLEHVLLLLASVKSELKEINYLKSSFTLDTGGVYLLSLLHVRGPKITLGPEEQAEIQGTLRQGKPV